MLSGDPEHTCADEEADDIYVILNMTPEAVLSRLPMPRNSCAWCRAVDTSLYPPNDIAAENEAKPLPNQGIYMVNARTCIVLIGKEIQ